MIKKIISLMLTVMLCLQSVCVYTKTPTHDMRGMWVSSAYGLDYPNGATTDAAVLKQKADKILDDCKDLGINTIFLQVRPASDALYKSEIFPWSQWLTGSQGTAPSDNFDPLAYWVEEAHKRNIELHAWINPYRVTTSGDADIINKLSNNNPAKIHREYIIKNTDGKYYYDPANPDVRQLIIDGVMEIVNKYDVDGIQLDDYFYPSGDFPDSQSFEKYNRGYTDKSDWRRNNVDLLIEGISNSLKDSGVLFGVSPSGIWANKNSNSLGSETKGYESYNSAYADSRKWALEGWIDYIIPQVYWEIGHSVANYDVIVKWWADTLRDSDTKLYIGIADYRVLGASSDSPWYNGAEVKKQLEYNDKINNVGGEAHFRYGSVISSTQIYNIIKDHYSNKTDVVEPTVEQTTISGNNVNGNKNGIRVIVDGEQLSFDQPPVIENSRTLIPMRAIFEAIGAEIEWLPKEETVVARKDGTVIKISIGSNAMYVNDELTVLEVPAKIISSRTMVPLRAVSEALGAEVGWDAVNKIITIKSK